MLQSYNSSPTRLYIYYLTNRFRVAVRLFSNRSQMTSKCRKNKEVAHEPHAFLRMSFSCSNLAILKDVVRMHNKFVFFFDL